MIGIALAQTMTSALQRCLCQISLKPPFEREEEEAPKKEKKKSKKNPPEVKEEKDGGDELKKRGDLRVKCRVSEDILLCREDYRDFLDVRSLLSLPLSFILFMISFVLSLSSYLPLSVSFSGAHSQRLSFDFVIRNCHQIL
jgi:hypothetical protein